ncbi:MAG TPA: acetate kinase [bacterium]|nr:acetate kinase [bacterium]
MKVLVINAGSSSLKYRLFEMDSGEEIAAGLVERIGEPGSGTGPRIQGHREAMELIVRALTDPRSGVIADKSEINAVGHRVVHGGEAFRAPALIDDAVLKVIKENIPLAPLHNPANLTGIEVARSVFAAVPQVAVFDTAFHQTLPPHAFLYALPYDYYTSRRIRRYGFHGTSHQYVAEEAAAFLGRPPAELHLITIHLGNGASMAAVAGGKSIDTSMGFTPLEGLVMGTRSGDVDPAIYFYLAEYFGMTIPEIEAVLQRESGLKGICGENDMREILRRREAGDATAALAVDIYAYRIKKYIGAYYAALGRLDAIIFTAGIGENAAPVRAAALSGLDRLGIILDPGRNESGGQGPFAIHADASPVKLLVMPTNEELEIARQTMMALGDRASVFC